MPQPTSEGPTPLFLKHLSAILILPLATTSLRFPITFHSYSFPRVAVIVYQDIAVSKPFRRILRRGLRPFAMEHPVQGLVASVDSSMPTLIVPVGATQLVIFPPLPFIRFLSMLFIFLYFFKIPY